MASGLRMPIGTLMMRTGSSADRIEAQDECLHRLNFGRGPA